MKLKYIQSKNYFEIYFFYLHHISWIILDANDKLVITQKLRAILTNVLLFSRILLLFPSPRGSWKKSQNRKNLQNICHIAFSIQHRVITSAYCTRLLCNYLFSISIEKCAEDEI